MGTGPLAVAPSPAVWPLARTQTMRMVTASPRPDNPSGVNCHLPISNAVTTSLCVPLEFFGLAFDNQSPPPSPVDGAYKLGWELGREGLFVEPPIDLRSDCAVAFRAGHTRGHDEYVEEMEDWDAAHRRLMGLAGVGKTHRHEIEIVESRGIRAVVRGVA